MDTLDPTFIALLVIALLVLMLLVAAAVSTAVLRVIRERRRAGRRQVERPNSHYTPQIVRENDSRHRWHDMALDRIHEINREEVVRLLAKVDATGVAALSPKERTFLDGMAERAGTRSKPDSAGERESGSRTLRHRPA